MSFLMFSEQVLVRDLFQTPAPQQQNEEELVLRARRTSAAFVCLIPLVSHACMVLSPINPPSLLPGSFCARFFGQERGCPGTWTGSGRTQADRFTLILLSLKNT